MPVDDVLVLLHDIQRPVVLLQGRERETFRGDHIVNDSPVGAPLGRRVDHPARQHREHHIRRRPRHPRLKCESIGQLQQV